MFFSKNWKLEELCEPQAVEGCLSQRVSGRRAVLAKEYVATGLS